MLLSGADGSSYGTSVVATLLVTLTTQYQFLAKVACASICRSMQQLGPPEVEGALVLPPSRQNQPDLQHRLCFAHSASFAILQSTRRYRSINQIVRLQRTHYADQNGRYQLTQNHALPSMRR